MDAKQFLDETSALNIKIPGAAEAEKLLDRAETLWAATKIDMAAQARQEAVTALVSGKGDPQKTAAAASRAVTDSGLTAAALAKETLAQAAKAARKQADEALFGHKARQATWQALSDQLARVGAKARDYEILPGIKTLDEAALLGYAEPWQALTSLLDQRDRIVHLSREAVGEGYYGRLPSWTTGSSFQLHNAGADGMTPVSFSEAAKEDFRLIDPAEAIAAYEKRVAQDTGAPDPLLIPQMRRREEERAKKQQRDHDAMQARRAEERAHVEALLAQARKTSPVVVV